MEIYTLCSVMTDNDRIDLETLHEIVEVQWKEVFASLDNAKQAAEDWMKETWREDSQIKPPLQLIDWTKWDNNEVWVGKCEALGYEFGITKATLKVDPEERCPKCGNRNRLCTC